MIKLRWALLVGMAVIPSLAMGQEIVVPDPIGDGAIALVDDTMGDTDIADLVVQIRHRHPGNVDVHGSLLRDQGRPGHETEHRERSRLSVGHSVTPAPPARPHSPSAGLTT